VGPALAREARARGIPTVFTYHTPSVSCQLGTMNESAHGVCDGRASVRRCAECVLRGAGVPGAAAAALSRVPVAVGGAAGRGGLSGGGWTALRTTQLIRTRIDSVRTLFEEVDAIVAVCAWVREAILNHGVPKERVILCRQGVEIPPPPAEPLPERRDPDELRLAFLGRLDPVKGLPVLIEALRRLPGAPLRLDLYLIAQEDGEQRIEEARGWVEADPRVRLVPPVASGEVTDVLRAYDALVVPSQGLETGPLVVLEAFAAGTPVVGSDLGGIAELVTHERDGLLVGPAESAAAWADALGRLAREPETLARLRAGIRPPRTVGQVAEHMRALYASLVARAPAPRRATALEARG
jgi:glycosyltransferase involved in cell wall biosynthesis